MVFIVQVDLPLPLNTLIAIELLVWAGFEYKRFENIKKYGEVRLCFTAELISIRDLCHMEALSPCLEIFVCQKVFIESSVIREEQKRRKTCVLPLQGKMTPNSNGWYLVKEFLEWSFTILEVLVVVY